MKMNKSSINMTGLRAHAEARNHETIEKVNAAIDKLKRHKDRKINFKAVAEEAGVAKATLYNNAVLRERICSLRALSIIQPDKKAENSLIDHKDTITLLRNEIRQLRKDKKLLVLQLEELEELRNENCRLKKQLKIEYNELKQ